MTSRPVRRTGLRPTTFGELFRGPVVLTVAGATWLVREFRIKDVAALENLLASEDTDPTGFLFESRDDPDRKDKLREALKVACQWPPYHGSEAFHEAMGTVRGIAAFVFMALSRENPELDLETVVSFLDQITPEEYARLSMVCWGRKAWEMIADELNPERNERARKMAAINGGPNPGQSVELVSQRGLSYAEIGEMTLTQFENAITEGEAKAINAGVGAGAVARSWKEAFQMGLAVKPEEN